MKKNDTFSVSVLIEQYTADAPQEKKLNFINNLKLISSVLGYERVKTQLINFIMAEVLEDEDHIILAFFDKIFLITEAFGGPLHNLILLPIFQTSIQLESSLIRDKACNKLEEAITYIDIRKNEDPLMKFIKKVDEMEYPETKQALARLITIVLGFFANKNNQTELLNMFSKMCSSDSIVSRKYASKYSKNLIKYMNVNEPMILKIVEALFKDKEESNKIFLIDTLIELSKYKPKQFLQPYFNLISYQFPWRIRYELISKVSFLSKAMDKSNFKSIFLPFYSKYLSDIQPEIRSIACLQLKTVCEAIDVEDIIAKIFPNIKNITQDSCLYVRNSFAQSILAVCPIIGKKHTLDHILPKFLQLLKDQSHEIRVSVFENIESISKVLGIQTLSQTTVPAVFQLSTNKNWRVRAQSIDLFLYFVKGLKQDFMNEKNIKFFLQLLKDSVFSVRKKTIESFPKLIELHGSQWFQTNIMPKIFLLQKATNYLQRQTLLFTIVEIAPLLTTQYINKFIVPALFSMAGDQVSNIRYNVCKCIGHILPYVNPQIYRQLIKNLKEDRDADVRSVAVKVEAQYKH